MLWSGVLPALLVLWIRRRVPESPLWLQQQQSARTRTATGPAWTSGLRTRVLTTALVMGALMFSYQSMSFWYATLLREDGRNPLPYVIALNAGGFAGAAVWGMVSDTRLA
jgi:SHS family lactate transporter-like MFS transporter